MERAGVPRQGHLGAELAQEGAPLTLNVRSQDGQRLTKGMEAIVVEHDEEKNTYVVVPFNFEVTE